MDWCTGPSLTSSSWLSRWTARIAATVPKGRQSHLRSSDDTKQAAVGNLRFFIHRGLKTWKGPQRLISSLEYVSGLQKRKWLWKLDSPIICPSLPIPPSIPPTLAIQALIWKWYEDEVPVEEKVSAWGSSGLKNVVNSHQDNTFILTRLLHRPRTFPLLAEFAPLEWFKLLEHLCQDSDEAPISD